MTNEQMRQRIAELEDGLRAAEATLNSIHNECNVCGVPIDSEAANHFAMMVDTAGSQAAACGQYLASLLSSAPPPASEPDADVVERVDFNDEQLLAHFYWRCDPHGPEPNTLALEIWEVLRNNINHPKVMTALSAMRPAIDQEKIAEIRARHDGRGVLSDGYFEQAHADRAVLLEMIDALTKGDGHED